MEISCQLELHLCIKIIIAFFLGALIGFTNESIKAMRLVLEHLDLLD